MSIAGCEIHRVAAIDSVSHLDHSTWKVDTTCCLRPNGDGERINGLS